jgi:hypothetical protein
MQKHLCTSFCFRYLVKPLFYIYPKLPYDNVTIPVNRIAAFRIVDHGHSNSHASEAPYGKKVTTF